MRGVTPEGRKTVGVTGTQECKPQRSQSLLWNVSMAPRPEREFGKSLSLTACSGHDLACLEGGLGKSRQGGCYDQPPYHTQEPNERDEGKTHQYDVGQNGPASSPVEKDKGPPALRAGEVRHFCAAPSLLNCTRPLPAFPYD